MKISELEALAEKATKGPWTAGRKTEYGTIWPDSIFVVGGETYDCDRVADVYGLPLNCKREELTGKRYEQSLADIDLIVYLANHRQEIIALVKAAQCIRHWHDANNGGMIVSAEHVHKLWEALAAFEEKNT